MVATSPDLRAAASEVRSLTRARSVRDRPKWFNFLLFGDTGAGKTVLAAMAGATKYVKRHLMVDIEGGSTSISRFEKSDYVDVHSWADIQSLFREIEQMSLHPEEWMKSVEDRKARGQEVWIDQYYDLVSWDNCTEGYELRMAHTLVENNRDKPTYADWGDSRKAFRNFVAANRDLPIHTIFVFHDSKGENEVTGETVIGPNLPGKLQGEIPGYFDFVFHLSRQVQRIPIQGGGIREEVHRVLVTGNAGRYAGKDRSWRLPNAIFDPDMGKILDVVMGEKDSYED